jgi:hypothetical protein
VIDDCSRGYDVYGRSCRGRWDSGPSRYPHLTALAIDESTTIRDQSSCSPALSLAKWIFRILCQTPAFCGSANRCQQFISQPISLGVHFH